MEDILDALIPPDLVPRFNIAPTQEVLGIIEDDEGRQARWFRWGLVPRWANDVGIGNKFINGRCETAAERAPFKYAFEHKRCILPATSFFEWLHYDVADKIRDDIEREGQTTFDFGEAEEKPIQVVAKTRSAAPGPKTVKQPFLFHRADNAPFGIAALWETWYPPQKGDPVHSCTILTTEPNDLVKPFHNRMPCMLHSEDFEEWLRPDNRDLKRLVTLVDKPYPTEEMACYPVTMKMNNPRYEEPDAIFPAEIDKK